MNAATLANSAYLAQAAKATHTLGIVTAGDIFDVAGTKLIGPGTPLTLELLERLARHPLRVPLETNLGCGSGIRTHDLEHLAVAICQGSAFMAAAVGHELHALRGVFRSLQLSPYVQLTLSIQHEVNPSFFDHALRCAVLAGALALKDATPSVDPGHAVYAGLLHDFGELYIAPNLARNVAGSDRAQWREIATHPQLGYRLAREYAGCPPSIAQAVHEHHERMDGSGYPRSLTGESLSPLGRLLAVADTVCGVIKSKYNRGAHAKLALSFVPGEFDPHWVSLLVQAIHGSVATEIALSPSFNVAKTLYRARLMSKSLSEAKALVDHVGEGVLVNERLAELIAMAQRRITRLMTAWEATGIATCIGSEISDRMQLQSDEEAFFDIAVISRELIWRMRSLARQMTLAILTHDLDPEHILDPLVTALEVTY